MADKPNSIRSHRIYNTKAKGGRIDVADVDKRQQKAEDLGVVNIDGRVYKPSVFYVLARTSSIVWDGITYQQNFVHKIVQDALKGPF